MRKYISTLIFSVAVVSSFGTQAYALEARPISETEQYIQQQSSVLQEKSNALQSTTDEMKSLEQKKIDLAKQLETETKTIEDLKQKLEEKKAAAEAEKKRLAEIKAMFVHVARYAPDSAGNMYAPGNCTWYVKNRRPDIGNQWGNANTWYSTAQAQGWSVGSAPKKGAVATTTAGYWGHVAYVEGVSTDGSMVTISEMNYGGLYNMNTRTVPASDFRYIYELD